MWWKKIQLWFYKMRLRQRGIKDVEFYPCESLIVSGVYDSDFTGTIVDMSQYEDKSLIYFIVSSKDKSPYPVDYETVVFKNQVVNKIIFIDGSEIWYFD